MDKHTPGPWAFSREDQFRDARFYVSQAEGAPYTPNYSDVVSLIAETVSDERVSIQEANARLIAAAPDLLEALHGLLFRYSFDGIPNDSMLFVEAARAAVAKATGEAS